MSIFSHVVIGTNDIGAARDFYDAVLSTLGIRRMIDLENASIWGIDKPRFMVTIPRNGEAATFANGGTLGFTAPNRHAVDEFHRIALARGGADEGAPGPRPISATAYAAYVRDRDGNKLCTFCYAPE